ncbi:ABC transporter substrate-binding protein [Paenarthrobacter sp. NPDC058040]|uniref:ABC transporter substrate-binding protein n=1 Tax=unclassified Paenarthrobacter TaxID=2634190 RepID=UPI0036D80A1A
MAINSNFSSLAPQSWCSSPLFTLTYEPLINVAPDGGYRSGLAESWSYSNDNKDFTLKLRTDAKFADGTPVDAQAVVKSLEFYKNNPGLVQVYMKPITAITAVDEHTVKVSHDVPFTYMETILSNNYNCNNGHVISPAGLADPKALATNTFGAGAYKLDTSDTVMGDHYTLVPNENYFDKSLQHYSKITFKFMSDPNTAFQALQTGQIDVDLVATGNLVNQAKAAGITVTDGAPSGPGIMLWDLNGEAVPALKDVRVRQALGYAIDRDAVAKVVGPTAKPLDQFALQDTPGYDPNLAEKFTYDPDKAKKLLADAGYSNGFEMTLTTFTAQDPVGVTVAQAIQPYLSAIGVKLTVKALPDASFFSDITKKQYPGGVFSFALNGTVFHDALRLYKSPYADIWNVFKTNPPELAAAYEAIVTATSPEQLDKASRDFNATATAQVLVVPIVQTYNTYYSKGVEMGKRSPNGGFDWANWRPSK